MYEPGDKIMIVETKYPDDKDDYGTYHSYRIGQVCEIISSNYDEYYEMDQYEVKLMNGDIYQPPKQWLYDTHMLPLPLVNNEHARIFLSDEY